MSDSGEKKHPASAKKLRDQRKKGQVAQSQDVAKLLVLTALSEIALFTADTSMQRFQQMMVLPIARIGQPFVRALEEVLTEALVVFFSFGLMMVGVAIGVKLISSWMQFGLLFAPESLKLDFNRVNPLTQLKQMFSAQSLMNLLMGIGKSLLLGLILYVVIRPSLSALINLANSDLQTYILALIALFRYLLHACLGLLLVLALIDLTLQKYFFAKRTDANARKLIDRAKAADVPVIQCVWLARTLYEEKLGASIPRETLHAVALIYRTLRELDDEAKRETLELPELEQR